MLEVILLWHFCKKLRARVPDRRRATNLQMLLILMWFGGEFVGVFFGVLLTGGGGAPAYIFGLAGATAGLLCAFRIAEAPAHAPDPAQDIPTGGFPVIQNVIQGTPGNPPSPVAPGSLEYGESLSKSEDHVDIR